MSHDRNKDRRTKPNGRVSAWRNILALLLVLAAVGVGTPAVVHGKGGDLLPGFPAIDLRSGEQHAKAMAVDADGNTVVVGSVGSGSTDYFVVKFKSDGSGLAWTPVSYGGTGTDIPTAVAVDSANNIIVTGYSWQGSNYDVHTIKYDGVTGAVMWEHSWDNTAVHGDDWATAIAIDSSDSIYVAGYSANGTRNDDLLILKYPSGGSTPSWVELSDDAAYPNNINRLTGIAAGNGGIAVTGYSSKVGVDFDVLTRKYGIDGTLVREWRYSSPGGRDDRGVVVKMDSAGYVAMSGYLTNAFNNKDIYSAKYNPDSSTPVWEKIYNNDGGSGDDEPQALWADASGDVYVTGSTATLAGNADIYTVRYNGGTGAVVWQKTFDAGNGSADVPAGIVVDDAADGGVFVTGYTTVGSTEDIITMKYRKDSGAILWNTNWNRVFNLNERPVGIALSSRNVVVAGWTGGGASGNDFVVLKYDFGPLNAPTKLAASPASNTSITLTWTDNSINEEKFIVQRKLGETGAWSSIEPPPAGFDIPSPAPPNGTGTVTFTDTDLTANQYYYYRVLACIGVGVADCSHYSNEAHALTKVVAYDAPSWSYVYDGADHLADIPSDITFGFDNHPVVIGYSELTEEGVEGMYTYDYMTIKLDRADKSVKWKARYDSGDGGTDMAAGAALDSSGNLLVTGTAYLSGGSDKSDELYTRKVSTSTVTDPATEPDFLWDDQFGTQSGIDYATAITMVRDGSDNSVVVGYGQNSDTPQDHDIFLLKLGNNGLRAWTPIVYDSGRNDEPSGIAIDSAGDIFVTGYSYDKTDNPEGSYDWFTAKYSGATGTLIWSDTYDISQTIYAVAGGNDQALSIDVDAAGNAYVTGYATDAAGKTVLYTVKYDGREVPAATRILWEKAFNYPGFHAEGNAVKVDPIDGAVVVAGTAYVNATDSDFHLIRYNPADGSLTEGGTKPFWQIHFDRPGSYEYVTAMAMDSSGYIYVTGNTRSGPDTDPLSDGTSNIVSLIYDYEGTFLGALDYDGTGRKDEATAITANYVGEAFTAGLRTNATPNADYVVLKQVNGYLLVPAPFTTASQADSSRVDLSWQHNNPTATFIIERTTGPATPASNWSVIATPGAGSVSFTDTLLAADTNYCYRINAIHNSLPSRKVVKCVTTRLQAPVVGIPVIGPEPSITITWNNITNNTGYKIERKVGTGAWVEHAINGMDITTYTDTGLTVGTVYSYRVIAMGSAGNSLPSNEVSTITRPAAPTLNVPTGITNCQMNLSWTSVTGASSYTLYFKEAGGTYAPAAGCTEVPYTGCAVTNLTPLVSYTFQVKAANASGESNGSNEQNATPVLAVPTLTGPTNVTNTSMYFTWTSVTGATSYTVEHKDGSSGTYTPVSSCENTFYTSCTPTGLTPGHTYYFRLRANSACGSSNWSSEKNAVTALGVPTLSAPGTITATSMNLSWTSVYGATFYSVEAKVSGGTYAPLAGCTGIATTSCAATGLTPNRTYYFHVKAGNAVANGDSAWSNEPTGKTLLLTPTLDSVTGGANQVVLNWTPVAEATNYKIEQSSCNSSATDPTLCRGADASYSTWSTKATVGAVATYTAASLAAGSNYRYRVTATVVGNTSVVSNVLHAWTNMTPPTLTVTPASETALTLSWDQQSGESGYKIERGPTSAGPWTIIVPAHPINTVTYPDINLATTTQYCYIVTAFNTEATPPPPAPSTPVCRTTPLPAPVLNQVSEITSTQMEVTWAHLDSNTGYEVERCPSSNHQTPTARTVGTPCTVLPKVAVNIEYLNDSGLTAGYTYRYRVRATYDTSDYTGWSNEQWATTTPPKPTLNTPSAVTTTILNHSWGDVVGDNGYKLYWKPRTGADCTAGTWNGPINQSAGATTYSQFDLSPGTYYCYYLVVTGAPGPPVTPDSPASDVKWQMTYPSAPVQADISSISPTSLTVNWSDVTGESGYAIYRKTEVGGTYAQVGTVGSGVTSFLNTGLSTGTTYYYMVYGTSAVGNSSASNEKSAATTPATPVITATAISDDRIDVCWQLVYGATYYKVDRKIGSAGAYGQVANPSVVYSTSYCGESSPTIGCPSPSVITYCHQDTGLTENTTYFYHVHSGNGTDSVESIERNATTLSIASQSLTATALDGGLMIRLDWSPMACSPEPCDSPEYYEIQRQVRDGIWMPLKIVEGTKFTYTDNVAIDPTCKYRYRIRSIQGALFSPFSEAEVYAKQYVPGTNVCPVAN